MAVISFVQLPSAQMHPIHVIRWPVQLVPMGTVARM
jgi:hypothetical protein